MGTANAYINREISWLSFNERVLQEALDHRNPLIERLKFLGIFSNNLDEFFRVRVATVKRLVELGKDGVGILGEDPRKLLVRINRKVVHLQRRFESIYGEIVVELQHEGIRIVREDQLDEEQTAYVRGYFRREVRPLLVPVLIDQEESQPRINDGFLYMAVEMLNSADGEDFRYAVMKIPTDMISRFLILPRDGNGQSLILLDDVIRICMDEIFPSFSYDRFRAHAFKVTRDAELDIENAFYEDYVGVVARKLKERKRGEPVRLVFDRAMGDGMLNLITGKLQMKQRYALIPAGRYHNFRDFIGFPSMGREDLLFEPFPPVSHPQIKPRSSLFCLLRERDIMLHTPYQSFHHLVDLLREAAIDPDVCSISMTLYRLAPGSQVINALVNAVRNGKRVFVSLELQARFDEKANLAWADKLRDNDVELSFGVPGWKVHSKLLHITRVEDGRKMQYCGIGTGNFNEKTSRIYGDDILLSADQDLADEVRAVLDYLRNQKQPPRTKKLLVSPFSVKSTLLKRLDKEIANARAGREAWCIIKTNSLSEHEMIDKLYEASQAGVRIQLIVRGICCLVARRKGLSENIDAISILDRFLEHSRVFIFYAGGKHKTYIGSADWMNRNLNNRIEVVTPIEEPMLKQELLHMLRVQLADNTKARLLTGTQVNRYRRAASAEPVRSQFEIYDYFRSKGSDS